MAQHRNFQIIFYITLGISKHKTTTTIIINLCEGENETITLKSERRKMSKKTFSIILHKR